MNFIKIGLATLLALVGFSIVLSILFTPNKPQKPIIESIEYLDYSEPDDKKRFRNYVADILYTGDVSYEKMLDIISIYNDTYKERVIVRLWLNKKGYYQNKMQRYGNEFKEDYVLYYSKNMDNKHNTIKWMQQKGKLSYLDGTQTDL